MKTNKSLGPPPMLEGYLYPYQEARKARDEGKLLSLRIETSLACNLKCEYCYRESGNAAEYEMDYNELIDVINQAHELGARSIVIIGGGEPTIYWHFKDLVEYIDSLNMVPVVITNAQTMTNDLTDFLYHKNASVLIKLDSLIEDVQDKLAGVKGAYKRIQRGLDNLLDIGFGSTKKVRIGASFVTNKLNSDEIVTIWRFCRDKNIFPNMETMTPNGRAKQHPELVLPLEEYQKIKFKLLEIDELEYGYTWNPYTPLVGAGCRQLEYSLCITVEGYARPCAAVLIDNVIVRPNSSTGITLKRALKHPFIDRARNAEKHLEGKCGICEYKTNECIGCRGSAYVYGVINGLDPFKAIVSEDPFCSKKRKSDYSIYDRNLKIIKSIKHP